MHAPPHTDPLPVEPPAALTGRERSAWRHLRPLAVPAGHIWLADGEGLRELQIDHASARGALSVHMMLQLTVHSLELAEGTEGLLLLGADPRSFCSGGDLRAVRSALMEPGGAAAMHDLMVGSLRRLHARPGPLVALARGTALGGGAELLTWPEEVVAEAGAQIGFPQLRLGLSPGWGGGARLARRVGAHRAQRLLTEGTPIGAAEALDLGLIDHLVADGAGLAFARSRTRALAARPVGLRAAARALFDGEVPEAERALFLDRWGSDAHRDALDRVRQGRTG